MIITEKKIQVTFEMMQSSMMTRDSQLGVPIDPKNPNRGLRWKKLTEMEDSDFDKIEEYFILKKQTQNIPAGTAEPTQSRPYTANDLNEVIAMQPASFEKGQISDGYHTFNELYEHRNTLFIALCKLMYKTGYKPVWKKPIEDGWFILGLCIEPGKQISYHLPESMWPLTDFIKFHQASKVEFDGHTSPDVLNRLKEL